MAETEQLYHNVIMDRFRTPRHAGRLPVFDVEAEGDNPICGDKVHVYFDRHGSLMSHESKGCAIMLASADLLADAVAGKTAPQIRKLQADFEAVVTTGAQNPALGELNALSSLSEYRSRLRCATLPWTTLGIALQGAE
jgi:nitrogen fixation NifU-like protein